MKTISSQNRILGCFLGGGVGDALGAPIEFMTLDHIRDKYGADGLADYDEAYGRRGAITDDTQMSLLTAEGLIRAQIRWDRKGVCHPLSVLKNAYLRWLLTQGESSSVIENWSKKLLSSGWLFTNEVLHHQRAPGNTVMRELLNSDRPIHKFADE